MNAVADWLRRISNVGEFIGGFFLIAAMLLLMSNIVGRLTNTIIPGSYELFELLMVVPVAFALFFAALEKYHVTVELIVSRFPSKLESLTQMGAALLSLILWTLIAWASAKLAFENGLKEVTDILTIPFLPFRIVWICFVLLFCAACLVDLFQAFRRFCEK